MTASNGINGGKNAGRLCWLIAHTMCKGEAETTFAEMIKACGDCDFYKLVKEEEGNKMMLPLDILQETYERAKEENSHRGKNKITVNAYKRKNVRYDFSTALQYSVTEEDRVSRRAISINISSSGLCLYLYEPLAIGQQIVIRKSVLPIPQKEATVRWIEKGARSEMYKAGVEFCS